MAIPIKDTPVLRGEDAIAFSKMVKENDENSTSISKDELKRMDGNYKQFQELSEKSK